MGEPDHQSQRIDPEQRRRFELQAAALAAAETNDEGTAEWRAATTAAIDRRRADRGSPPLKEWWEDKGEQELHERARALGLLRPVR